MFAVDVLPKSPWNIFVSGDGDDKCYVWKLDVAESEEEMDEELKDQSGEFKLRATMIQELKGHTESVEFCKFDASGKWLVTGGMNNILRVWDVENDFALKTELDAVPQEDLNFVQWHPTAPVLLTGGRDYMLWMLNAVNGKLMASFGGHEEEVLSANFTLADKGKQIISCSADRTLKVWQPLTGNCERTIMATQGTKKYHESPVNTFALHPDRPLVISGDESGSVFAAHYGTGEI